MTVSRDLNRATQRFKGISDTPRLDAELLMAAACGIGRDKLLLDPPTRTPAAFAEFVERRSGGEPVAYITGHRGFWTIDLEVGPGALIPRPDSETLIESAVTHFAGTPGPRRILDLGTGPGTLLLAALDQWPLATGVGIDRSTDTLAYAARNATRLGLADRAELRIGNWAEGIDERFDLVLCNPPYIAADAELGPGVAEHEPHGALFAGADGLDDYRNLAGEIERLVAPGGLAAIEIGHDQGESAARLFREAGLAVTVAQDLGARDRALLIRAS